MKFVVDCMLGSLAKWLRILGYDAAYWPHADDRELVRVARAEGRTLVTRDVELSRSRNVDTILIQSQRLEQQLRQMFQEVRLPQAERFSRCPTCNGVLEPVDVEAVADRIPPYVAKTQPRFHRCLNCGKVYWPGTHRQAIERWLRDVLQHSGE